MGNSITYRNDAPSHVRALNARELDRAATPTRSFFRYCIKPRGTTGSGGAFGHGLAIPCGAGVDVGVVHATGADFD